MTGMAERGYTGEFATSIVSQIRGFAEYGFPESHAASFALLAYASSWLKCHEPAAFLAALSNSQPMGFYSASALVQDARRHGVKVRPVDVSVSAWEAKLEPSGSAQPAVRLGLNNISEVWSERPPGASKKRGQSWPSLISTIWRHGRNLLAGT